MKRSTLRLHISIWAALPLIAVLLTGNVATSVQATQSQPEAAQPTSSQSILVLRVYFRDAAERDSLATELGAEEVSTLGGYLTVLGDGDMLTRLRARGLRVQVDLTHTAELQQIADRNAATSGNSNGFSETSQTQDSQAFFDGYLTVAGIEAFLDQTVAQYPGLAEKVDLGDSWCKTHPGQCVQPIPHGGYDLWVLHITNRAIPGPKPVFWFDAGIHSREIATPELAMRFVSYLLDGYNTDADAHWLVDYHDIWVMPVFNPDGHFIVESGLELPYYQRKNADQDDGCTIWPPRDITQFGTDLNRNFPFKWACCHGSSLEACEQTYRGPAEASEEETQAVVKKIRELVPDQRGPGDTDPAPLNATGVYQNLHSYADLNLYPWGWTEEPAPNDADLRNIAAHMSAQDAGGNGYDYCQAPTCLYVSDGTGSDWGYGELGMYSITTELGGDSFFPNYADVQGLWDENRGMLLYLAKIARTPYLTTRGPDVVSPGTGLEPVIAGATGQISATINYAWTDNAYSQNVGAAEFYIDTPPWAGGTPVAMSPADGVFDSPTEGVVGAVDTKSLTPGRHFVFVRGRGLADYGGFGSWGPVSATWLVIAPTESGTDTEGLNHRPTGSRPGR